MKTEKSYHPFSWSPDRVDSNKSLIIGDSNVDFLISRTLPMEGNSYSSTHSGNLFLSIPEIVDLFLAREDLGIESSNILIPNSEEHIVIDRKGVLFEPGTMVYLVLHGVGLLRKELFKDVATDVLQSPKTFTSYPVFEMNDLLIGVLSGGHRIPIYNFDQLDNYINQRRYGIAISFEFLRNWYHDQISNFSAINPIDIARYGSKERLKKIREKTQNQLKIIGNTTDIGWINMESNLFEIPIATMLSVDLLNCSVKSYFYSPTDKHVSINLDKK